MLLFHDDVGGSQLVLEWRWLGVFLAPSSAAEASWRESLVSGYKTDPLFKEIIIGLTDSTAKVSDKIQAKLHWFSYD